MSESAPAARGSVTLSSDTATLLVTSDPVTVRDWPPRKSVIKGIGGSSTTQDFGLFAVDCLLTLTWDGQQVLALADVRQLLAWLGTPGQTLRYQDGEGNDFTVEILQCLPNRVFGQPALYGAQLQLHVLAMDQLLGEVYTGS